LAVFCVGLHAYGQSAATRDPKMAPLDQYMMERNAEIALARTAAPEAISHDADVFVMGPHGYENAVKGTNGFVCAVQRSWTAGADDPDFWNAKLRAPNCFNAAAARSYWPLVMRKTELVLAGMSKERMFESIQSSIAKKELPAMEPGAMSYMLSREQFVSESGGHWHPHLMFFVPETADMTWGAGVPNSPVLVGQDHEDHLTIFMILVGQWSDGKADHADDKSGTPKH